MMIVSQMKQLNDHKVTFRVDLEPGEEVHPFLSSYRQKTLCVCAIKETARQLHHSFKTNSLHVTGVYNAVI